MFFSKEICIICAAGKEPTGRRQDQLLPCKEKGSC